MDTIGGHITPLSLERGWGEALSPFTLPRKVNGVTTPFDADCTVT